LSKSNGRIIPRRGVGERPARDVIDARAALKQTHLPSQTSGFMNGHWVDKE